MFKKAFGIAGRFIDSCLSKAKALMAPAVAPVAGAGAAVLGSVGLSYADLASDVQAGITSAQGTALTIGGYVVTAVAALVVVGLAIMMVKKLG